MNKELRRQRQMEALQSRHDMGLTDKIIGRAIDRHPDTVGNWRRGITELKVGDLMALDHFFSSMGDWQFVEAVCGELTVRRRLRADQLERQAHELRRSADVMSAAEGAAA